MFEFEGHHVSVAAWPKIWFTESARVRDGAAASLLGVKVFQAPSSQHAQSPVRD
jgi:hypothetical protein